MLLLSNLKNSIYGPDFYASLIHKKAGSSFKYFFGFILVLSLLATIGFVFFRIPTPTTTRMTPYVDKLEAMYPADLVVTIKNGQASTNSATPTVIDFPSSLLTDKSPQHLLVIDTSKTASVELFQTYKTAVLLTRDAVIAMKQKGDISMYPLSKTPDITIDKALISKGIAKVKSFLPYVLPIIFVAMFIAFFIGNIFALVGLLITALLIWPLARLLKVRIGYGKAYQIGLHAATLAMILDETLFLAVPKLQFPFAFTIITLLVVTVNYGFGKKQAVA